MDCSHASYLYVCYIAIMFCATVIRSHDRKDAINYYYTHLIFLEVLQNCHIFPQTLTTCNQRHSCFLVPAIYWIVNISK